MTENERGLLHKRTLELVQKAPRSITYSTMARHCGVSNAWISRFAAEKMGNPSVNYVERLYNYLSGL